MFNVVLYWCKLLDTDNCILKVCYESLYMKAEHENVSNWANDVVKILNSIGYSAIQMKQELHKCFAYYYSCIH